MLECRICLDIKDEKDFFLLECCKQQICNNCLNYLTVPLCPYCRKVINEIKDDLIYKQGYSYEDNLSDYTITQFVNNNYYESNMYNPRIIESRILRRKIRKLHKLRERQRNQNNRNIQLQIQEELDIFYFES